MPITPSPAVLRAGDVLAHYTHNPGEAYSVSELARLLGMPRATCDAVLQALAEHRFVARRDDRRYELGPAGIALGDAARVANPALRAAADETEQLARRLGWCGAVAVRDGGEARVVDVFDFGPPFGPRAKVGQTIELVPPFGAVFVAWHGDDVETWLAHAEDRSARTQYRTSLETIRQRGYSITLATQRNPELAQALETLTERPNATDARRRRDELIQQMMHAPTLATELADDTAARISQISAPVFDAAGGATTSIMLVGPDYDITGAEAAQLGRGIADAAARATERGGGRRPETW